MAITWRNVAGDTGHRTAGALIQGAQQSLDSGIGALQKELARYQATDAANWQTTKQNNTNAYLDKLQSYATPEELQAAQASGELQQMAQGFGAQVDRSQIRGAADRRVADLRQSALDAVAYDDKQNEIQHRPAVEELNLVIQARDTASVNRLLGVKP